jgi:hypothetical protein
MDNVITRESQVFTGLMTKIKTMENEIEAMKKARLSNVGNWLNAEAVLLKMGICSRTLQNWRDNGTLPYSTIGGKFYYAQRDIEDLMDKNYVRSKK